MAAKMRYRFGDAAKMKFPVLSATVLEVGDNVALVAGLVAPFNSFADAGTLTLNQNATHDFYLGVCLDGHPANSGARDVTIATKGVFEFDQAAAAVTAGNYYGCSETGGTIPTNQIVVVTVTTGTTAGEAIGIAVRAGGASQTFVLVNIISTVIWGGVQTVST